MLPRKEFEMAGILKLKRPNERKEIEFELRFLKSLSVRQRFELMLQKTREMVNLLERNGHRRPFKVIKRT